VYACARNIAERSAGRPAAGSARLKHVLRLLCLLVLTACSRPPDSAIRFGLASAPASLDPRYATDATSERINRLLYRRLVDFDAAARPVPALARWEQRGPTRWRFYLRRPRAPFHDGTPLTAADVAATYRSMLAPGSLSPQAGTLRVIRSIRVIDDDTLDFELEHPDALFPGYLAIGIVPAHASAGGHPLQREPVGSGPFRFTAWPDPGRLILTRIADGQRFEFLRVPDPTVRTLKLLRGELDLLQNDLPAELVDYLGRQPGIRLLRAHGNNFAYLGFNLQDPAMSDLRVRQAIAHAIDRAAIVKYVLGGAARTAAALLPPEHWAGNPALQAPDYDPAAARRLLQAAGYDRRHPLQLDYKTSTDPVRVRIATILQQQLAQVGIRMKLNSYDWGTFFGDIKAGHFQLYSLMWVGIKTPDIFRYAFYSHSLPPGGANRGHYADAASDRLIEQAGQADSLQDQAALYRRLQARLLEQLPCVPLWYEDHVAVLRASVTGYRLSADGNFDGLLRVHRVAAVAHPAGAPRHPQ
jgi:peptide/nickel transport system substrate-binding protein